MQVVESTAERLVLRGSSPLFRPFFLGGLGFLALGAGILGWRIAGGLPLAAAGPGSEVWASPGGLAAFLVTFGFSVAMVPLLGRFPHRKDVVVDRANGRLVRRDRSLKGTREEVYTFREVRGIEVEELRHVDGDRYFTLRLCLDSGKTVPLDRFTDGDAARRVAGLMQERLN